MASTNDNTHTCPICFRDDTIRRVGCSNAACSFSFVTCANCDREQAVAAFRADHEKDCAHGVTPPVVVRSATFVAPRRAA